MFSFQMRCQVLTRVGECLLGKCFPSAGSLKCENVKLQQALRMLGVPSGAGRMAFASAASVSRC